MMSSVLSTCEVGELATKAKQFLNYKHLGFLNVNEALRLEARIAFDFQPTSDDEEKVRLIR